MKRIVISGAVLALAISGTGLSSAAPATLKITGGGQTLVPEGGGAGDTVGFNAQLDEASNTVKGQFQFVDRTGDGTGRDGQQYHGTVTCVAAFSRPDDGGAGGVAVFGGVLRDGVTPFRVDVTDSGQGEMGMDMILVQMGPAAEDGADGGPANSDAGSDNELCDAEDETGMALSRGNVTIHKAKGGEEQGGGNGGGKGGGLL